MSIGTHLVCFNEIIVNDSCQTHDASNLYVSQCPPAFACEFSTVTFTGKLLLFYLRDFYPLYLHRSRFTRSTIMYTVKTITKQTQLSLNPDSCSHTEYLRKWS